MANSSAICGGDRLDAYCVLYCLTSIRRPASSVTTHTYSIAKTVVLLLTVFGLV